MSRIFIIFTLLWAWTSGVIAQEFGGLARIDAEKSHITDAGRDGVQLQLALSQGVPYRLFTLSDPPRLVLDFQEVEWSGLTSEALLRTDRIAGVSYGAYVPGWSRMVLDLGRPRAIEQAGLDIDQATGVATLAVQLRPVGAEQFRAQAGAPHDPRWDLPEPAAVPAARGGGAPLHVVLDPGHGGIDPGAETERTNEKTLMLTFARELREVLLRSGDFKVTLTRNEDRFVSLERRVALAHRAGADVFISLHADALAEGLAHGATIYTLSEEASDAASAKLAERHDRSDIIAGVDLSHSDDQVADVLLDLARQETQPRTAALAQALAEGMAAQGGPMHRRPLREAAFSVLKAADIPSVLVELGFLSSPRDLKNIENPEWRAGMARGILTGLRAWRKADLMQRSLVRK
ncbi:N-acetylmuramoyl-L-alanine amidase [Ruegeria marisrubri]|uniref:N-acetylmuramoyl-L-alanine amidase n=1 Tax=Ruegeria marisrubri TaxID=1685379 RepID=A0A0X3TYM1_9RHOB|nr:N-acetylmuramoyl-L-alanine amidase [Ruegeria marisrubri]KUJ80787.1 N-acetylmuramoyl-L-alanine amidase [Ruegeria marisrubri]